MKNLSNWISKLQEKGKPAAFIKKRRELRAKPLYIFRWEVFFILSMITAIVILNMIPEWYVVPSKFKDATIFDTHPLFKNAAYQNVSIVLIVFFSLWTIFFVESSNYLGKYGSAIFILVPSMIWLMSDRGYMSRVMDMEQLINKITSWGFFAAVSIFMLAIMFKITIIKFTRDKRILIKYELLFNVIYRFMFMFLNVIIALIVSTKFINFGIITLDLSDPDSIGTGSEIMSPMYIGYIATISILCGFLLIILGVFKGFSIKAEIEMIKQYEAFKKTNKGKKLSVEHHNKAIEDLTVEFSIAKKKRKEIRTKDKLDPEELDKVVKKMDKIKEKIKVHKKNKKGEL